MATLATVQELEDIIPMRGDMGSAHPPPATDWLAGIDQAKSVQYLDDDGSVFGSTRMSFDPPRFRKCETPHEDHESGVQKKSSGGRRTSRTNP